jgi:hypothetical protein
MSTEAQIAWAAGLFDGEGCVRIQLRKPRGGSVSPHHHLVVDLSNTHEQTVLRFSEIVGGTFESRPRKLYEFWKFYFRIW